MIIYSASGRTDSVSTVTHRPYCRCFMHQHKNPMKKTVPVENEKCALFSLKMKKDVPFFLLSDAALFSKIWPISGGIKGNSFA